MTTGVKDGIKVAGLDGVKANHCREPRICICIGFGPMRKVGLKMRLVLRDRRRFTTFGDTITISTPASLNVK